MTLYVNDLNPEQQEQFAGIWRDKGYYSLDLEASERFGFLGIRSNFAHPCDYHYDDRVFQAAERTSGAETLEELVDNYYREVMPLIANDVVSMYMNHNDGYGFDQMSCMYALEKMRLDCERFEHEKPGITGAALDFIDSAETVIYPSDKQRQILKEYEYLTPLCLDRRCAQSAGVSGTREGAYQEDYLQFMAANIFSEIRHQSPDFDWWRYAAEEIADFKCSRFDDYHLEVHLPKILLNKGWAEQKEALNTAVEKFIADDGRKPAAEKKIFNQLFGMTDCSYEIKYDLSLRKHSLICEQRAVDEGLYGLTKQQMAQFTDLWRAKDYYSGDVTADRKTIWSSPFNSDFYDLPKNMQQAVKFTLMTAPSCGSMNEKVDRFYSTAMPFIIKEAAEEGLKNPERCNELFEQAQKLRRDAEKLQLPESIFAMLDSLDHLLKPDALDQKLMAENQHLVPVCRSDVYLKGPEKVRTSSLYKTMQNIYGEIGKILHTPVRAENLYWIGLIDYGEQIHDWNLEVPIDITKHEQQQIVSALDRYAADRISGDQSARQEAERFKTLYGELYCPKRFQFDRCLPPRESALYFVQSDDLEVVRELRKLGGRAVSKAPNVTTFRPTAVKFADDRLESLLQDERVKVYSSLQDLLADRQGDKEELLPEKKSQAETEVKCAHSTGRCR